MSPASVNSSTGTNTTRVFTTDPYPVATIPGGVAVVGNVAWAFGGFDTLAVSAATHVFDITAADGARWTDGPDLALARGYISAATVDGLIYAIGGDTWDGAALHAVQVVERLDPANPTAWDDAGVADLPAVHAIEHASFDSPWPPEAYRNDLETNRLAQYLVARVATWSRPTAGCG